MIWYIFNFSIFPAVVVGLARARVLGAAWYPFLTLLCLGFCNELLSVILIHKVRNNSVNGNVYTLAEYLLIMYQFYCWNSSGKTKYVWLAVIGTLIWMADNLFINSLQHDNSIFRACYGFILVFLSIELVNIRIINGNSLLRRDAIFVICCGFCLYFGCRAFMEVFDVFGISFSNAFETELFLTLAAVNCIANITYTIALLCIPMKQRYSWRS